MVLGREEIDKRFGKHSASIEGPNPREVVHVAIRQIFVETATKLDLLLEDGRAKVVCLTELETASMWAHKQLAHYNQNAMLFNEDEA